MRTSYGASLNTLELAFATIELTAVSYGYPASTPDLTTQAAAVLAAELLARVCTLDSLEHASRLSAPAREALHAVFCLATGTLLADPSPAAPSPSNMSALSAAETALRHLADGPVAPYLPQCCNAAYRCLAFGSADPRLAAAADALLP